jgi:hypothetical protein
LLLPVDPILEDPFRVAWGVETHPSDDSSFLSTSRESVAHTAVSVLQLVQQHLKVLLLH